MCLCLCVLYHYGPRDRTEITQFAPIDKGQLAELVQLGWPLLSDRKWRGYIHAKEALNKRNVFANIIVVGEF